MTAFRACAALLVLILTNALVFGGIAWNRSGEPTGSLSLNDCLISYRHEKSAEQSYIAGLWLRHIASTDISADTIESLGVELGVNDEVIHGETGIARKWQERKRYVVLQYNDGVEWQNYVEKRKQNPLYSDWEAPKSGLIIVDGGNDPDELLEKYGDYDNIAIMPGHLAKNYTKEYNISWSKNFGSIAVESQYRDALDRIWQRNKELRSQDIKPSCDPYSRVVIKWGQRYEPWISSVDG